MRRRGRERLLEALCSAVAEQGSTMAARRIVAKPTGQRAAKLGGRHIAKSEPRSPRARVGRARTDPAVDAFMRELDHPLKKELEALRQLILSVSPEIHEGIKWNSPSFRTTDWFATANVHGKDNLRLILHTGAKVKDTAKKGLTIADPAGLLRWLAKDRCLVTLGGAKDIEAKRAALEAVIREWIRLL